MIGLAESIDRGFSFVAEWVIRRELYEAFIEYDCGGIVSADSLIAAGE